MMMHYMAHMLDVNTMDAHASRAAEDFERSQTSFKSPVWENFGFRDLPCHLGEKYVSFVLSFVV